MAGNKIIIHHEGTKEVSFFTLLKFRVLRVLVVDKNVKRLFNEIARPPINQ
jgi:hypothetical protein